MFARQQREGWDTWGNEVNKFDVKNTWEAFESSLLPFLARVETVLTAQSGVAKKLQPNK
jgi:hypothetical protein